MRRSSMRALWCLLLVLAACGGNSGGGDSAGRATETTAAGPASGSAQHGDHGEHGGAASCSPTGNTVAIVAQDTSFNTNCLAAPANQPFTLSYENKDAIGHNLVFLESHTASDVMFRADIFRGPTKKDFSAGPFRPGTYAFHCEVHPQRMQGTFVVK
jgi:plastocyanin